jgi:hypothetical protein
MPMPFYEIGRLLQKQFQAVSFGAVKFGLSPLARYGGGFSNSLVSGDTRLLRLSN